MRSISAHLPPRVIPSDQRESRDLSAINNLLRRRFLHSLCSVEMTRFIGTFYRVGAGQDPPANNLPRKLLVFPQEIIWNCLSAIVICCANHRLRQTSTLQ